LSLSSSRRRFFFTTIVCSKKSGTLTRRRILFSFPFFHTKTSASDDEKIIKVTNVSPSAQESDLTDFFSTAGDISKLVVKDGLNNTKRATIDFKEKEAVSAALLLNGCLLLNHALCIEEIKFPAEEMEDLEQLKRRAEGGAGVELSKGETIASGILAKTITLGKQAGQAIKQFDEQHKISETVVSKTNSAYKNVDEKLHLTETTATMKVKISEESQKLDEKFKVSATAGAAGEVVKNTSSGVVSKINENETVKKATTAVSNAFSFLSQKANAIVSKAVADSEKEMPSATTKAATTTGGDEDSSPKSTVPEAQKA
jgi:RNA recognition motif-containing protein